MQEDELAYVGTVNKSKRVAIPKEIRDGMDIQQGDILKVRVKHACQVGPSINYMATAIRADTTSRALAFSVNPTVRKTLSLSEGDTAEFTVKKWKRSKSGEIKEEEL